MILGLFKLMSNLADSHPRRTAQSMSRSANFQTIRIEAQIRSKKLLLKLEAAKKLTIGTSNLEFSLILVIQVFNPTHLDGSPHILRPKLNAIGRLFKFFLNSRKVSKSLKTLRSQLRHLPCFEKITDLNWWTELWSNWAASFNFARLLVKGLSLQCAERLTELS